MKQINYICTLLLLAAMLIGAAQAGAQEKTDTLARSAARTIIRDLPGGKSIIEIYRENGEVTVDTISPDSARTIIVTSTRESINWPAKTPGIFKSSSDCSFKSGGFNFGWNFAPGHAADAPVEPGKSLEIGWFQIAGVRIRTSKLTSVNIGVGMDWKNYKITTPDYRFAPAPDNKVSMLPYPPATSGINSRLKIFTLTFPLMLKQKMPFRLFGNQQWLGVGASVDYSPHGSLLTRWRDDSGRKMKTSENKIGHRRWSYELIGMVGVSGDVGVYIRYQPLSVLRGQNQPHFRSLSTGLIFFY